LLGERCTFLSSSKNKNYTTSAAAVGENNPFFSRRLFNGVFSPLLFLYVRGCKKAERMSKKGESRERKEEISNVQLTRKIQD
jgi:hypothetical protein